MTQPSSTRFVMEDRYLADQSAFESSITATEAAFETSVNNKIAGSTNFNHVINGGFDFWQRGVSGTPTSSATAYVADRFESFRASYDPGLTISRQTAGPAGFQYALRAQRTAADASLAAITVGQAIETPNSVPLANQVVTLSFYARKGGDFSGASSVLNAHVVTGTGTDQNLRGGFTSSANTIAGSATLTTSWQRFTYTGTLPSGMTQAGVRFTYTPVGVAGAADYFDITGVKLEIGSVASTFIRNGGAIQAELSECQRYYQRFSGSGINFGSGTYYTNTQAYISKSYPDMRVAPAASASAVSLLTVYSNTLSYASTAISFSTMSVNSLDILATTASRTAGHGAWARINGTAYLELSAEL